MGCSRGHFHKKRDRRIKRRVLQYNNSGYLHCSSNFNTPLSLVLSTLAAIRVAIHNGGISGANGKTSPGPFVHNDHRVVLGAWSSKRSLQPDKQDRATKQLPVPHKIGMTVRGLGDRLLLERTPRGWRAAKRARVSSCDSVSTYSANVRKTRRRNRTRLSQRANPHRLLPACS